MHAPRKRPIGTAAVAIATLAMTLGAQVASAEGGDISLPARPGIEIAFAKLEDQLRTEQGRGNALNQMHKLIPGVTNIQSQYKKFFGDPGGS